MFVTLKFVDNIDFITDYFVIKLVILNLIQLAIHFGI